MWETKTVGHQDLKMFVTFPSLVSLSGVGLTKEYLTVHQREIPRLNLHVRVDLVNDIVGDFLTPVSPRVL